ncbi:MAG TPA: neutral/alkaline non-lysosomal ceramidase N-terminal domain-containing protein [Anaeromyxobacteraceae bacterium]|nr:neutral/alkaline non-lysosomal ceramidase N-terminal domain-containing protein [Anaeromyxobacteraceae bacterium]
MKKLLTGLGALVALLALALGLLSLRWYPARPAALPRLEAVARGAGPFMAGAAAAGLSPPRRVPVAGFPHLQWMAEGERDPVAVRALVLRDATCTFALVSAEILLVPGDFTRALERALADLKLDGVVVGATHTHAGPGGYWDEPIGERFATGPYDRATFEYLVERAADAVREATRALEPASLEVARGLVPELARNRGSGEVDGRLVRGTFVGRGGRPIAEIILYPAHATLLGPANRLISGDWPGALMREGSEPVLFFQGALGDQAPRMPRGEPANPEVYARALRERLLALPPAPLDPSPELALATARVVLPPPELGASPAWLGGLLRNVLYRLLPGAARVMALRVGNLVLIAIPGEPVAEVGREFRALAGEGSEILALAGDYLGYVETSEHMEQASGETVHTYYGPGLAARLALGVKAASQALQDPAGSSAGTGPGVVPAGRGR